VAIRAEPRIWGSRNQQEAGLHVAQSWKSEKFTAVYQFSELQARFLKENFHWHTRCVGQLSISQA
jgi:hypothetical protein